MGAGLCRQLGCHGTSNLRREQGARPIEQLHFSITSHMRSLPPDQAAIVEAKYMTIPNTILCNLRACFSFLQAPPVRQLQQFFAEYPGLVKFIGNIILSFFTP